MSMARDKYTNVVAMDAHAQTNDYAILAANTGQVVDAATFPTTAPDLKRVIDRIVLRCEPGNTLVVIESTKSYGSSLPLA